MIGLPAALVMLQPDLGTALSICIGGVVVMFAAGLPFWWFGSAAVAGAAALPILFSFLHDYQQKRVQIGKHTSELQSLMRISYAVFCLKKKNTKRSHMHPSETKHKKVRNKQNK